jgi:hypothetical protein
MSAAASTPLPPSAPRPEVLARIAEVAWTLEPLAPHERSGLLRDEAAFLLDGLLVRVARGEGALDVAIGEGLEALAGGDRLCRLGYSRLGDYARERLGLLAGCAARLVRLARALRERPLLRAAVRRGELSARKAEAILPVARGGGEAAWVARARGETVRALCAAVRDARAGDGLGPTPDGDPDLDEPWTRLSHPISPEQRAKLGEALALAGAVVGATAPVWRRVEAICQEYLGDHPAEPTAEELDALCRPRSCLDPELEALKEGLEHEYRRWEWLGEAEPFEAPASPCEGDAAVDPFALDARLRELASMRDAWDPLVGHLGMLVENTGVWRDMGFASVGHYAEERLGMSGRALEQRAALERRLWALPELRDAVRARRLSYEKARLVASHAAGRDVAALVARAEGLTCIALRRALDAEEERAQLCERREVSLALPRRVALFLAAALRAARDAAGRWLTPGEALAAVADHFVRSYQHELAGRRTRAQRALERDRGLCQVPGCSRPAVHAHHVRYRSRGGSNELVNLLSTCAGHHLHGIHAGYVRVSGHAPDALTWELPAPPAALHQVPAPT